MTDDAHQGGIGPHPQPWPNDAAFDPKLLAEGDSRNVADRYRYLSVEAIVALLAADRSPLHIAVENWQHDLNIGSIVRTANAFNVAGVHIVGRRRWNRRGAMVTDRYVDIYHHSDPQELRAWAVSAGGLPVLGIDNVPGSTPLEGATLPRDVVLLFGQEGPGLSSAAMAVCDRILAITQYGSTRSMNAAAAGAIAMYAWALQHRPLPRA